MLIYAVTIFLSAFLLFQVQPMIAKIILPWFGGTAAVWATCLLFFQVALLGGYAYSHGLIRRLPPKRQWIVHVALLVVCLALLPITPDASWKPLGTENPTLRILGLLAATIGLPYFMLSTTGPLVQAWYAQAHPGAIPYRLFALSNLGSMLALLTYPPLIEPRLTLRAQTVSWSVAFGFFALCCALTGWQSYRHAQANAEERAAEDPGAAPSLGQHLVWILLAACPSILLLALTSHLTQDVAPIPFLWVLPLALYLLTFILCFDASGWYRRNIFLVLSGPALGGMLYLAWNHDYWKPDMVYQILAFAVCFFLACMTCHGELSRRKPHPHFLTGFFLMVSIGGALGGVMVALVAPYLFQANYELPLGIAASAIVIALAVITEAGSGFRRDLLGWASIAVMTGAAVITGFSARAVLDSVRGAMLVTRNFYGELRVKQDGNPDDWDGVRTLMHGRINHGEQYTHPSRHKTLANYYCEDSGIGLAIRSRAVGNPQKIGVIGLGTGTLAAYGRSGDEIKYYEINPLILDVAKRYFTYLKDSDANVSVAMGDARLVLEREAPQGFDVLAVDAFSSDSIPVHLLTKEAMALYFRHLNPDGILAVHISNRYLRLEPVIERAAAYFHKPAWLVETEDDDEGLCFGTTWVLITARRDFFTRPDMARAGKRPDAAAWLRLWTDDYSNLFQVVK